MNNLGLRIKEVRLSRGIKSKYVAEKLGVSDCWVTRREKGYVNITVNDLKRVADVLGVPAKIFFA